jgi:hypothetical protein
MWPACHRLHRLLRATASAGTRALRHTRKVARADAARLHARVPPPAALQRLPAGPEQQWCEPAGSPAPPPGAAGTVGRCPSAAHQQLCLWPCCCARAAASTRQLRCLVCCCCPCLLPDACCSAGRCRACCCLQGASCCTVVGVHAQRLCLLCSMPAAAPAAPVLPRGSASTGLPPASCECAAALPWCRAQTCHCPAHARAAAAAPACPAAVQALQQPHWARLVAPLLPRRCRQAAAAAACGCCCWRCCQCRCFACCCRRWIR